MATIYVEQTVRVVVTNLTDADGVALSAPVVLITVTDPNGDVITPSVTDDNPRWYAEFSSSVSGAHVVRVTATSGGGTWRSESVFTVHDFS